MQCGSVMEREIARARTSVLAVDFRCGGSMDAKGRAHAQRLAGVVVDTRDDAGAHRAVGRGC